MGKSISELYLPMQARVKATIEQISKSEKLKQMGVEGVAVVETGRTLAVQMAYYSRGRMEVPDVKRMYAAAGLYTPTETECKIKNTNTLNSKHIEGKAVDLCLVKDGKLWWNATEEAWETMGEIGEANGLKWGGRWKDLKDSPHFEI